MQYSLPGNLLLCIDNIRVLRYMLTKEHSPRAFYVYVNVVCLSFDNAKFVSGQNALNFYKKYNFIREKIKK